MKAVSAISRVEQISSGQLTWNKMAFYLLLLSRVAISSTDPGLRTNLLAVKMLLCI